jgi:hypothetical protein
MQVQKYLKTLLIFSGVMLFFNSCIKEIQDIKDLKFQEEWKPGMAVPLVHSQFSIDQILKQNEWDSLFQFDPDNFMSVVYQKKFVSEYASDFISIQDQAFNSPPLEYNVSGDSVLINNAVSVEKSQVYDFSFGGDQEIEKITLKQGNMNINLTTDFRKSGELQILIPNAKKGGQIFNQTITFSYTGQEPIVVDEDIDLKGYTLDLTGSGSQRNKVPVTFKVTLYASGTYIRKDDDADIKLSLSSLDFSYIEGYLGYYDWNFQRDSLLINIYDGTEGGRIYFADPKINMELFNTLGAPISVETNKLKFSNSNNEERDVQSSLVASPFYINYPTISQRGKQSYTEVVVNKDNSNLPEILSILPNHMFFDFDIELNKDGKVYDNFALDTSTIKMDVELELPLHGRTENWTVVQDNDFEMPELVDDVEKVQFNIVIENGFPMEAEMQLYFVDSNDVVFDSLLTTSDYIFRSAKIDNEGKVSEPTKTVTSIEVYRERVDEIKNTRKLRLQTRLSTTNNGQTDIKIYSHYIFDVKLSLLAKVKKDLNEK